MDAVRDLLAAGPSAGRRAKANHTGAFAWAGGRPAFQAVLTPIPGRRQANDIIDGFGAGSGRLFINSRSERWRESDAGCSVATCTFTAGTDKRFDEN